PGLGNADVEAICERVRRSFEATPFASKAYGEEPLEVSLTVSIGVCEMSEESSGVDSILAEADKALYRAKNSGRNRVCR
ncbi:MAG: diguanylate cyclase, partial [Aminobacteriaceae bacterium]